MAKSVLFGALAGALVVGVVGCKGSLEPQGGTGGSATGGSGAGGLTGFGGGTGGLTGIAGGPGTGGSGTGGGEGHLVPLVPSSTGFVDDPVSGVIGPWYSYSDGVGPNAGVPQGADATNSDCELHGGFPAYDCSQITEPPPGVVFAPTDAATGKMCTSGTAAMVMLKAGSPDYADLWGAGIGLNFNEPNTDGGFPGYIDLSAYKGISFEFSADVLPVQAMRVNFPFKTMHGTDAPYWMGATLAASPLTGTTANPQHVEIDWPDIGGPFYLTQSTPALTPPAFDPTVVESIQFQVFTNTATTTPYAFCVSNLALVLK